MNKNNMLKACVDMMVEYDSMDSKMKNNVSCPYTDKIVLQTQNGKLIQVPEQIQNMAISIARPKPNVGDKVTNYDPNLNDHKLSRMPVSRSVSSMASGVGQTKVLGPDIPVGFRNFQSGLTNHIMERENLKDHPIDGFVMPNDTEDNKYPLDLHNQQYISDTHLNRQRRIGERGFPTNDILRENSQLAYSIGSNSNLNLDLHDESDDGMTGVNDIINPSNVLPKSHSLSGDRPSCPSNYLNDNDNNVKGMMQDSHDGVDEVYAHVNQDGSLFGKEEVNQELREEIREEFQQPCGCDDGSCNMQRHQTPTFDYTEADYDQFDRFDDCPHADAQRRYPNFNRYDEYSDLLEHMNGGQNNMWWFYILIIIILVSVFLYQKQ